MQDNLIKHVLLTEEMVADAALQLIITTAVEAISQRGRFVLSLAGGTTPKLLYKMLAKTEQDWHNWYLIYGDERCLPDNDINRNSLMIKDNWLKKVDFPESNHFIPDTSLTTEAAALLYAKQIEHLLPLDMALLGMGEDGHTASLFPKQKIENQQIDASVLAIHNAPKPPTDRISLSYSVLNQARLVCFMVTGESKQSTVKQWLNGDDLPVSQIAGIEATYLFLDDTAGKF